MNHSIQNQLENVHIALNVFANSDTDCKRQLLVGRIEMQEFAEFIQPVSQCKLSCIFTAT